MNPLRAARLTLLLLVAAAALQPARAQELPPPLAGLDTHISQAMDAWRVPGLAIAVVKNDSVVYAEGFGVRELGEPEKVTPRTVFLIASTTKAFTAASLAMMVDAGKLEWDDRVTEYLPRFQLGDPWVTRELTVRDLLTHRSGLERGDRLWWALPYSREEVLRRARYLESDASFRSEFEYNNIMYMAAGEVLEAVSGREWDAFVRERILLPLGMTRTTTSVRALPAMENVATRHEWIDGELRPIEWSNYDALGPAGAINSTVLDMAEWLKLQLDHGVYEGERLLSDSVFEEMHESQMIVGTGEQTERYYPSTHFRTYGFGWFLRDYRGHKVVQHSGALAGMRARVGLLPEEDLGVVLFTNTTASNLLESLMYRVFDAYIGGRPLRDRAREMLAVRDSLRAEWRARRDRIRQARVEGTEPSLALARYAGTYRHRMYGEAEVSLQDGALVLRIGPYFTGDLEHWHYNTFRIHWRDPSMGEDFITFTLNPAAEVEAMTVEDWAVFERVRQSAAAASASEGS